MSEKRQVYYNSFYKNDTGYTGRLDSQQNSKTTIKKSYTANKQKDQVNSMSVEKKIENDTFEIKKVSRDLQLQIQQARMAKKWDQKKLADECQLPVTTIRDYENGTIVPTSKDLVTIGKVLGIHLSNKHK